MITNNLNPNLAKMFSPKHTTLVPPNEIVRNSHLKYLAKKIDTVLVVLVVMIPASLLVKYLLSSDTGMAVGSMLTDAIVAVFVVFSGVMVRTRIMRHISEWNYGFDALFMKNPQPMWIYDMEHLRFLKVNEAACRLYGYSEAEFARMTIADIRPDEDVPALMDELSNDWKNIEIGYDWSGLWRHKKKDGSLIYAEVSSHKLLYDGRRASFAMCYDVTRKVLQESELQNINQKLEDTIREKTHDLLKLNQQLVEQNRAVKSANQKLGELTEELRIANAKANEHAELRGRFVSMVSHEFRTPISSIRFCAEFIKRYHQKIPTSQLFEKLKCIDTQTKHMEALVNDVVTVGKNDVPPIKTSITQLVLDDFFRELIKEVAIATNNTHQVLYTTENLPATLSVDEKLMRNIFINLLGNAIKYSPGKKSVSLKGSRRGGYVVYMVEDDGIGIRKEDSQKIFEPFFRSKDADHLPGSGLGLSIVKRAVELLGGKLSLEHRDSGGSIFTVELPEATDPS